MKATKKPNSEKRKISYSEFVKLIDRLEIQINKSCKTFDSLYPIPRGGYTVAHYLSHRLNLPIVDSNGLNAQSLIVEDIIDSGETAENMIHLFNKKFSNEPSFASLFERKGTFVEGDFIGEKIEKEWIVMPWEED